MAKNKEKVVPTADQVVDLSFYKANTLGYFGILGVVVLELYYLITMLNNMVPTVVIGAFILINIGFLLVLFTSALQVKVYNMASSYAIIIFGGYCLTRVVTIHFLIDFSVTAVILSIIVAIMGVCSILLGLDSVRRIKNQRQYIKDEKINFVQLSK